MLDDSLRRLLEHTINTSCKLAIVLWFAERPRLVQTAEDVSRRLGRDIWSVEQALHELAEDGILREVDQTFHYDPIVEQRESMHRLLSAYDEPLRRQEVNRLVEDLDRYAPYRDLLKGRQITILST